MNAISTTTTNSGSETIGMDHKEGADSSIGLLLATLRAEMCMLASSLTLMRRRGASGIEDAWLPFISGSISH
ncbi:hypothetical protein GUJ93_ZPchr0452g16388 [Zizania palustris]|uniref:Uncharacterized protein n=1 Tax=Zizania palustris TaxID=103762 RepID=A0A8J5RE33_ZIZPA|nr:hypothetical protein GUJ93_ZPchr0452g16388 [Zizania palustris]